MEGNSPNSWKKIWSNELRISLRERMPLCCIYFILFPISTLRVACGLFTHLERVVKLHFVSWSDQRIAVTRCIQIVREFSFLDKGIQPHFNEFPTYCWDYRIQVSFLGIIWGLTTRLSVSTEGQRNGWLSGRTGQMKKWTLGFWWYPHSTIR